MKFHSLIALPLLALALPASAETVAQELEYKSAFEGYQTYSEPEVQNWPQVNDTVGEIGGWQVYAREPYEEKKSAGEAPEKKPSHQHGGKK